MSDSGTPSTIDLRSDTVTRPGQAMREAMYRAEVGDDCYAEDPTVSRLEALLMETFGFTAALFVPTGVMGNQLALRLLAAPGQEVICDADAHFLMHEDAGVAWHGGVQTRTTTSVDGILPTDVLRRLVRRAGPFSVGTRALAVENTHNRAGGMVYPLEALQQLRSLADESGIAVHCDGARIWNAHIATGIPLREWGSCFDTLSVCLSKGLGAPAGSVLLLPEERLEEARVMRHRMGGGLRQAGILAAAGIYAVEHHVSRLAEDHANATLISRLLTDAGIDATTPETNIVLIRVPDPAHAVTSAAKVGVRISAISDTHVRVVTHLDVASEECREAGRLLAAVLN